MRATGRLVALAETPWLEGPVGDPAGIGPEYFQRLAEQERLTLRVNAPGSGLTPAFAALAAPEFDPARVDPAIVRFYETTSAYSFDVWSEWCGVFRPFGRALAAVFSRRLRQLNMPLSPLDTSGGVASDILQLVDPAAGTVRYTGWLRRYAASGLVLYAGCYSLVMVPGHPGPCVRVVFPLPNGSATVILKPLVAEDGSFTLISAGERFGDPGFYFLVRRDGVTAWARYLRTLRETIRVYRDADGGLHTDHVLRIWGAIFLRLHYRLYPRP